MFEDTGVGDLFFHAGTKLALLVVLVVVWWVWVRRALLPYLAAVKHKASSNFPLFSLIPCTVLTIVFVYYATFEPAYREVHRIENELLKQREANLRDREDAADDIVVPDDGEMSLQEKSEQRMQSATDDNDEQRQRFEGLEPMGD